MSFKTEGAVAAIAPWFLVAAAVDKSGRSSKASVGFLTTLTAMVFAAAAASSPQFVKIFPILSVAIVLSETNLVLVLLLILQSLLNNTISFPVFL